MQTRQKRRDFARANATVVLPTPGYYVFLRESALCDGKRDDTERIKEKNNVKSGMADGDWEIQLGNGKQTVSGHEANDRLERSRARTTVDRKQRRAEYDERRGTARRRIGAGTEGEKKRPIEGRGAGQTYAAKEDDDLPLLTRAVRHRGCGGGRGRAARSARRR